MSTMYYIEPNTTKGVLIVLIIQSRMVAAEARVWMEARVTGACCADVRCFMPISRTSVTAHSTILQLTTGKLVDEVESAIETFCMIRR